MTGMAEETTGVLLAAQIVLFCFIGLRLAMAWIVRSEKGGLSKEYVHYFMRVTLETVIALIVFFALLWWMGEAGQ